jgi:hypothetical protein
MGHAVGVIVALFLVWWMLKALALQSVSFPSGRNKRP